MAIKTTDFPILTDDLQELTVTTMNHAVAEMDTADMVFDIKDVVRKTYDLGIIHGVSGVERVAEGSDYPRASTEEGDTLTLTQAKYGSIVPVTEEMRLFDLYDQISETAQTIVEDGMDKLDQSLADVLGNGFSASAYTDVYGDSVTPTGPDGFALFYALHSNAATSNTFSNIITDATVNPALSRSAIIAERVRGMTYADVNGLIRPIKLDTLIVAPTNEDLAERLLFSNQIPGEANNDVNALKGKIKSLKVWERLETRGDATDTSAYWYMADSARVKKSMKTIFSRRPQLFAPNDVYETGDWEYKFSYLYQYGFGWAPYIRGSNATGA